MELVLAVSYSLDLKRLSLDIVDILMTVLPNDAEVRQCCCGPFVMRWSHWVTKPKMRLGAVLLWTIRNKMVAVGHETENEVQCSVAVDHS